MGQKPNNMCLNCGNGCATGLPSWIRVAANATSDASVSTSKGMLLSMAVTKDFSTIFLRSSNVPTASDGSGKDLQLVSGLIRLENSGIHYE